MVEVNIFVLFYSNFITILLIIIQTCTELDRHFRMWFNGLNQKRKEVYALWD